MYIDNWLIQPNGIYEDPTLGFTEFKYGDDKQTIKVEGYDPQEIAFIVNGDIVRFGEPHINYKNQFPDAKKLLEKAINNRVFKSAKYIYKS